MFGKIFWLFLVTMIPLLELRASIPLGILSGSLKLPMGHVATGFGMNWVVAFVICVAANMVLGILLYPIINHLILLMEKIPFFGKFWKRHIEKTQAQIHKYVEKWGTIGVAIFIGVPLPGSGTYSGALGSYLIGLSYKKFILANCLGVVIAGVAVTIATLTGQGLWALGVK